MEEKKTNLKNKRNLSLIIIILLVAFMGGVIGCYTYLDYRSGGGSVINATKNVTVNESSATIDAVKKVSPAVVSITGIEQSVGFFGNVQSAKSSGTGFIVTSDGLILTNKHVVESGDSFTVYTSDGKQYKANIKSIDPNIDIAFLKIDAKNLPVATLGNSDNLQIGQSVIAIGNALGQYQNTVTQGIVSALGRAIEAGDGMNSVESLDNVIQTDAAINSGNSGGPLINLEGQVIGINTAVASGGQSIGFAIPINVAKSDIDSVITKGKVIKPMLGVRYIPITKEFAISNDLPVTEGAFIYGGRGEVGVLQGGPADKAGLKEGDIIVKINNDKITKTSSITTLINKYKVGDSVKITYLRDGKEKTATLVLVEAKN